MPAESSKHIVPGGQLGAAMSQKNSQTREFPPATWYSRPQVGVLLAGAPSQGASAVVQVFVHRFRPCSAPTLTHTSPLAHCGSPCCAIGAQAWPKPGKPPVESAAASLAEPPLLPQPSTASAATTVHTLTQSMMPAVSREGSAGERPAERRSDVSGYPDVVNL